jgi:hypothetical protein
MKLLPLTAALAAFDTERTVDLTPLATAEMEFEGKVQELRDWLRSTRPADRFGMMPTVGGGSK